MATLIAIIVATIVTNNERSLTENVATRASHPDTTTQDQSSHAKTTTPKSDTPSLKGFFEVEPSKQKATTNTFRHPQKAKLGTIREIEPGFFSSSDYANYDNATLERLAKQGDTTAMQILAKRYLTTEYSEENARKAKHLMEKAAVHGARYYTFRTLANQASFKLELALRGKVRMKQEDMQEALTQTFAYAELAALRGNPTLKNTVERKFERRYSIQLSPKEWRGIKTRADEMYNQLQSERKELGLGPFDNSPPQDQHTPIDKIENKPSVNSDH